MMIRTLLFGYFATILVFILRIIQGLSVGGELPSGVIYIMEKAPFNLKDTLIAYVIYDDVTESNSSTEWTWRIHMMYN